MQPYLGSIGEELENDVIRRDIVDMQRKKTLVCSKYWEIERMGKRFK